jgi:hypothetical protein
MVDVGKREGLREFLSMQYRFLQHMESTFSPTESVAMDGAFVKCQWLSIASTLNERIRVLTYHIIDFFDDGTAFLHQDWI